MGVGHVYAYIISMCQRIGHHTFLYPASVEILANGVDRDGGRCMRVDVSYLCLGNGHLHLYRADVKDADHGLRGQCSLTGTDQLFPYDAADRSHQPAVGKVLPSHLQL